MFSELLSTLHPLLRNDISGIELPTFQYLQNPGIDYLIISVGSHPRNRLCFLSQQLNRMKSRRQQGGGRNYVVLPKAQLSSWQQLVACPWSAKAPGL